MLIYVVRHGETNANVNGYLQGWTNDPLNENGRKLAVITGKGMRGIKFDCCISSPLVRARETAEILFERTGPIEATPLLDDVPIRAFRDTGKALPLWLWKAMGEAQWRADSRRQGETRYQTERRVEKLADRLEAESKDCIVICRGLTLAALKTVLRRRGFLLEGGGLAPKPLERVRATKKILHCGGCHHNCLLSEAKCHIGREKARERGIVA